MDADRARKELYGNYLDDWNLFMPIGHLIPIMQQASNNKMHYKGLHLNKHPCDAWVIQEIISEYVPHTIIEIGSGGGGSSLYLFDILKHFRYEPNIITIDIMLQDQQFPDIKYIRGNSEDKDVIEQVEKFRYGRTMVIDDCSHTYDNVTANLKNYGPLVSKGCYYIVEDTFLNHGLMHDDKWVGRDNPMAAVEDYMLEHDDFEIDRTREKFFLTACPKGFLRKVK